MVYWYIGVCGYWGVSVRVLSVQGIPECILTFEAIVTIETIAYCLAPCA